MTRGWFDLFRDNGGPALYPESNRTSVVGDVQAITVYIVFATLLVAFLVVMPGIRAQRFTTFTSVALSLFVGGSTLVGICGCGWHTAEAEITSAYRSFSNEKIYGKIGVYIGLTHVNVTLDTSPEFNNRTMEVAFNERFGFDGPTQLMEEFKKGLKKGLPFPILTVAEYMALDAEGFCWGRNYRQAGYYCSVFLWASFALWILMNITLVAVPRYGAYLMVVTGSMMNFSVLVYYWLLPSRELKIPFEDVVLTFELGWCFWLILTAGSLCLLIGASISVIDLIYPHKFSIILEMDYGGPFDRHTLIDDSHETKITEKKRRNKPKLEDPAGTNGLGGLLRRLSKRDRDRGMDMQRHPGGDGEDNFGFDMEAPKSPWRYPHLMFRTDSRKNKAVSFKQNPAFDPSGMLRRTDSKESNCSSIHSIAHGREDLRQTLSVPVSAFHKQFKRTDSNDSNNSSLASFGLSILSRNNSKKTQLTKKQVDRMDSDISRGFVMPPSSLATVSTPPQKDTPEIVEVEDVKRDEVAIVVGSRKNSMTKAVRRNSAEHKRDEAAMW